jgi:hypothetical protein
VSVIVPIALWRKLAATDNEPLTAAQRSRIDSEIEKGRKSGYHDPFSGAEAVRFLKRELKTRSTKAK